MTDFVKSTAILTEHLGYAPISLIDDIINAVNDILYKCTSAMETFLNERYGNDETIPEDEIELGTAKLETLLESIVDKSFDKFEIYVLRNLLVIPPELISEGWIRLSHHRGIDFDIAQKPDAAASNELDDKIIELRREIYAQKHIRFLLQTQSRRCAKLLTILQGYKDSLLAMTIAGDAANDDGTMKQIHKDISPVNESILFLASQVTEMMEKIKTINESMSSNGPLSTKLGKSGRDSYVNTFSRRAVESAGLQLTSSNNETHHKSQHDADQAQHAAQNLIDDNNNNTIK